MELIERVRAMIAEVREEHAPDPRLAVYEVRVVQGGSALRVVGAVSDPGAHEALRRKLGTVDGGVELRDEVARLPDRVDAARTHALVCAAVAPLLAGPLVSESHLSQTVLGHHLLVLRERGRWLHVRSEDGYLGWIHRGYVHRVDEVTARGWVMGSDEPVHLSLGAALHDDAGRVMARLPWGARFLSDGTTGMLPNGRAGTLSGDAVSAALRHERFPTRPESIVATAEEWLGAPYIWGGITPAGCDCSGFVQAVYRMHGLELPRDSDQQALRGEPVEPGADFSDLRAADLLFFAEEPGRVSHVAISLGGSRILHSAMGNGGIRENDLAGRLPLERELRRLFTGARRVV